MYSRKCYSIHPNAMDILEGPDNEMLERIKEELKEDNDRFENNLLVLEQWMDRQPHLPKNYDKRMLPIYLRGCKHDMEKAKRKMELYFTIKSALPQLFSNRDPERKDILEALQNVDLAIMPKLTPQGYRVTLNRLNTNDTAKFQIDLQMARGAMSTCLRTVLEKPIAGDILVFDTEHITASHAAIFFTPITRRCIMDGPEAYPNRIRQVHIVNAAPLVEKVISVVKSLLKEKLRNRFHVHVKTEGLTDFIPPCCLPNEYGGTAGNVVELSRRTHDFTIRNYEWLKEQESVKLIGPLPEKYNYKEDYGQGAEGSFRKLAID